MNALFDQLLNAGFINHAFANQLLGIFCPHAGMRLDALVHQRLRVAGLVGFVVTQFSEADHVEHDVFLILLPVIQRDAQRAIGRFGILAVDVKDGQLGHAGDVGRVNRRAPGFRRGGKPDLIIDDDVNRAPGAIAAKLSKLQSLHHDALAGESGIAMQQHRQRAVHRFLALQIESHDQRILPRACHALDHGIDGFQMTGVR